MPTSLPSWIMPLLEGGRIIYPGYDVPILGWHPAKFEGAFVALHPFFSDDASSSWERVARDLDINVGPLNRGLLTSIGGLRAEFGDDHTASRLKDYCFHRHLDFPTEGQIPTEWTELLARFFREHGSTEIWVRSEFGDTLTSSVASLPALELALNAVSRRGAVFSTVPGVLVTLDWDSFFTLFFGPMSALASVARVVEGFFCSQATTHYWGRAKDDGP